MRKKIVTVAALLLLAPLGITLAAGYYYGVLSPVPITEKEIGPYTLVYLSRNGDYSESSGPLYKIHHDLAEKYSLAPELGFGIYYDSPAVTETKKLRSDLGALLPAPMDPNLIARLSAEFRVRQMERTPCLVATFPYRDAASPMIGAIKVYPALAAYLAAKQLSMKPTMEIYDIKAGKILYVIAR